MIPLLIGLVISPASAGDDVLLDALDTWAHRAHDELAVGEIRPAWVNLATLDQQVYTATAVFGALEYESLRDSRPTRVEVVVGDDRLNSMRFSDPRQRGGDWQPGGASLPVEDVPLALERDLWITTDGAFKQAAVRWHVKAAALEGQGGAPPPPEWSPADPVVEVDTAASPAVDPAPIRDTILTLSAALRPVTGLEEGGASVRVSEGAYYLATSEGTRLRQPESVAVLYVWASAVRGDGVRVHDHRVWVAEHADGLPAAADLVDEVRAMGDGVQARLDAKIVDAWEGPVLFEGSAAADVFRYLAAPELEGTPPAPMAGRTWQQLMRQEPRLSRRLLPDGWTVTSGPGQGQPGSATYDREGVPVQGALLVDDGFVHELAMTRIPRHDQPVSNGHARGDVQGDWLGRMGVWTVTPDRTVSARRVERLAERARDRRGLDRVLVVRNLGRGSAGSLSSPTDAVWRLTDGTELPIVTLSFEHADRRSLRDIVAASGTREHSYLAPSSPRGRAGRTTGLDTTLIAPERLLIEDLEVVFPGPTDKPYALEAPPLATNP